MLDHVDSKNKVNFNVMRKSEVIFKYLSYVTTLQLTHTSTHTHTHTHIHTHTRTHAHAHTRARAF